MVLPLRRSGCKTGRSGHPAAMLPRNRALNVAAAALSTLLLAGCSGSDGEPSASPAAPTAQGETPLVTPQPEPGPATNPGTLGPSTPAPVPPPAPVVDAAALNLQVQAAGESGGGQIHLSLAGPDGKVLASSPGAEKGVYTASLVKTFVVQQLLAERAAGTLTLDGGDLGRMERAIVLSDDDAMSALWGEFDGARLVREAAAEFGLTATTPPAVPGQWGQAVTSAADYTRFLAALDEHLAPADLQLLRGWMSAAAPHGADGFDQQFGFHGTGDGTSVKQGWMCCVASTRQLHSGAVLPDGRYATLLGEFPSSTSWASAAAALDAAAAAVRGA